MPARLGPLPRSSQWRAVRQPQTRATAAESVRVDRTFLGLAIAGGLLAAIRIRLLLVLLVKVDRIARRPTRPYKRTSV